MLLGLDKGFMELLVPFSRAVTARLRAIEKERRDAAKAEYDELTVRGRRKLEELKRLGAERDGLRADLNRLITARNSASARLQAVKRSKPSDASFASHEEFDSWEVKLKTARREFDKAEREADALRSEMRSYIPRLMELKSELSELRAKREAVRKRAGLRAAGEEQANEEESESLVARG